MNNELTIVDAKVGCNLQITKTLIGQADDLAVEHENFHDHYIVGGRAALYELLGKIYGLAEQLDGCVDRDEQLELLRTVLAQKHGIRTQENTSDTTVLVRYITKADRKTAHVYSRAIETARKNGIASNNFVSYVEQAGGVERIRSNAASTAEGELTEGITEDELEDMLDLTRNYLRARSEFPLGSFKSPKGECANGEKGALTHYICHERNGRQYVLAERSISKEQETAIIKDFAKELCADGRVAKKRIGRFYAKAMKKRKQRTLREITRQRPALGAALKATGRWS